MPVFSRADFSHYVTTIGAFHVLIIQDLDCGNVSVTNDIENVVADICSRENLNPALLMIVYQDSLGEWTGWDFLTESFFPVSKGLQASVENHINNKK